MFPAVWALPDKSSQHHCPTLLSAEMRLTALAGLCGLPVQPFKLIAMLTVPLSS